VFGVLACLLWLGACDGGGGGGGGASDEQLAVKEVLRKVMNAALKDDVATATPHLDLGQYLQTVGSADAARVHELKPDEHRDHLRRAFDQAKMIFAESTVKDAAGIETMLRTAKVQVLSQTKSATVTLEGPDAKSKSGGTVKFKIRLTLSISGGWKLFFVEPEF
jgi:hypothetical protein